MYLLAAIVGGIAIFFAIGAVLYVLIEFLTKPHP